MQQTPQHTEDVRPSIFTSLQARLSDAIDLYTQIKVAHWNVRGSHFAALHPLFDNIAHKLQEYIDVIAERAATLGAQVAGTARYVAETSRLPEYPAEVTRDLEHVQLLADRFDTFLSGLRETRAVADENHDLGTLDLLTRVITDFEKYEWFLRATLEE
jgi:starvation-inducible DNA-binding protein